MPHGTQVRFLASSATHGASDTDHGTERHPRTPENLRAPETGVMVGVLGRAGVVPAMEE
jgi:hypothetical protein